MNIIKIGITYNTPTYIYFWNSLFEPIKIFLVKSPLIWNFTALLLHPMWCTHFMWRALLALFLLYRELFSNRDLSTNYELCGARTLKNFTTLPDAASLLHPMWHTHFMWWALLALFLLYPGVYILPWKLVSFHRAQIVFHYFTTNLNYFLYLRKDLLSPLNIIYSSFKHICSWIGAILRKVGVIFIIIANNIYRYWSK